MISRGRKINRDDTSAEYLLTLDSRWYEKSALIIDNVNKVSQSLYIWPGFSVFIFEMMMKKWKKINL